MVRALPRLQEVLGEEGVDELVRWLDDRIAEQAVPRDEYREVLFTAGHPGALRV